MTNGWEPKSFLAAVKPMIYFHSVLGLNIYQYSNKLVQLLLAINYLLRYCCYGYMLYVVISSGTPEYFMESSSMSAFMYRVLAYTNTGMAIVSPLLAWLRKKKLRHWLEMVSVTNDRLLKMFGVPKQYKMLYFRQLRQIVMIGIISILISVADYYWFADHDLLKRTAMIITFHQPIMIMLVTDFTFCNFVRCIGRGFHHLNEILRGLIERPADSLSYPKLVWVSEKILNTSKIPRLKSVEGKTPRDKRHIIQKTRKIHLELSHLACKLNFIFGVQNLLSMAVSFVMITGFLYTVYIGISGDRSVHHRVIEVAPSVCWTIIYAVKLWLVDHFCWKASSEAEETGEVIYEILGSSASQDLQKEIEEFGLQLIQNPVKFTACGFFALDYTHVQGVIGSVTTYLVILIQMGDVPSSNKKA